MVRRPHSSLSARKSPKQERSARLVDAILKAAIRVLEREGAQAFTTSRVAERAGVSVGSLYQYFPNKQSILFHLQRQEWDETSRLLEGILEAEGRDAEERLREAMRAFFRTEFDEAPLRRALEDAAPLYRDSTEAHEHRRRGVPLVRALVAEAAPWLSSHRVARAAALYLHLLAAMGKHVSEMSRTRAEVDGWARTVADIFLASLRDRPERVRRAIR
jgi:AcrR family transcriptional regulator